MKPTRSGRRARRSNEATVRAVAEALENRLLLATFTVMNANDSGVGSLRQALADAGALSGKDTILLQVPGGTAASPQRIIVNSALPGLYDYLRPGTGFESSVVQIEPATLLRGQFDGLYVGSGASLEGVWITGFQNGIYSLAQGATIGSQAFPNAVFGNTKAGIRLPDLGAGHEPQSAKAVMIRYNAIYNNGALGIDLGDEGLTVGGTTKPAMAPKLDGATRRGNEILIAGSDVSTSNTVFCHLDFYASPAADASGYGEGQVWLGSTSADYVHMGAMFNARITPATSIPTGWVITATQTTSEGTSQFSNAVILSDSLQVTTNADAGAGSLRQAILDANARAGADFITFNLPAGSLTITPSSTLPSILESLLIDGTTQPGYGNQTRVVLDGNLAGLTTDGLTINASNSVVQGLDVTRFRQGVVISGNNNRIGQNHNLYDGDRAQNRIYRNRGDGVRIVSGAGNLVGGSVLAYNGGLGINLGTDGQTPNDASDGDTGPNNLINYPVLLSFAYNPLTGAFTLSGSFASAEGLEKIVDLYAVPDVDDGSSPALIYLGNTTVGTTTNSLSITGTRLLSGKFKVLATVTRWGTQETSETSPLLAPTYSYPAFNVCTTDDSGPGSLRQAILDLNASSTGQSIWFNIAGGSEAAPKQIQLLSPLPVITQQCNFEYSTGIAPRSILITTAPSVRGTFDGIVASARIGMWGQAITGFRHGLVLSGQLNQIGYLDFVRRNAIYGNAGDGVRFIGSLGSGYVRNTDLSDNGGLAVDNGGDGVTPNDAGDADTGNNDLLNSPTILSARVYEDSVVIQFSTMDLPPSAAIYNYFDFFLGSDTRSGATGQGGKLVYTAQVATRQISVIGIPLPASLPNRPVVTVSFTLNAFTSELSAPVRVEGVPIDVITMADSGAGSLRAAIALANANAGYDVIRFNLPAGSRKINLLSPLPEITGPVMIDGYSATMADGDPIRLSGAAAPADTDGLVINSPEACTVRGLAISGFRHGIVIAAGNGHVLGTRYAWGTVKSGWNYIHRNRGDGIRVLAGSGHTLRYNSILYNTGLPIDLGGDGTDPADVGDIDTGPNDRINATLMDYASKYGTTLTILNSVRGQAGGSYTLDYWAYSPTDVGAELPQAVLLGTSFCYPTSTADAAASFMSTSAVLVSPGFIASVRVTDGTSSTSEVAETSINSAPKFYITSTADSGPNTLRQALLDGNATAGANDLYVNLPANTGAIDLLSPLPAITGPIRFLWTGGLGRISIRPKAGLEGTFDGVVLSGGGSTFSWMTISGFRHGIVLRSSGNVVESNTISSSSGDGVRVESGTGNRIRGNSIFNFGGLPIDLGGDGATPNDPLDTDTGANDRQNHPLLIFARRDASGGYVSGRLDSKPNTLYVIDLYLSAPPAGPAMRTPSVAFQVTTGADGSVVFNQPLGPSGTLPRAGEILAATATDPQGNTSELGVAVDVSGPSLVVTSEQPSGAGSLRDAIVNSGYYGSVPTITFNIPGAGTHRISTGSSYLPAITSAVVIDATTQPSYAGSPLIELVGPGSSGSYTSGLAIESAAAGTVIRGLAIGGFDLGVYDVGNDIRLEACYLGLSAAGTPLANGIGVRIDGARAVIGGTVASARNVISGNSQYGLSINGNDAVVTANYIGTDPAGMVAVPNRVGVRMSGNDNTLGGPLSAARNVVSGNTESGVFLDTTWYDTGSIIVTSKNNRVLGNYIGTAADGMSSIGNGTDGIYAISQLCAIGGPSAGEGNVIAFNGRRGVSIVALANVVGGGQFMTVRGNSILSNGALGIDLGADGVTPNDALDADTGANGLQNAPDLSLPVPTATFTTFAGTLHSTPDTTFVIDFYASPDVDPTGYGEGAIYLGSTSVTTDGAGDGMFWQILPVCTANLYVSATATDAEGNTSEFSAAQRVPDVPAPQVQAMAFEYSGPLLCVTIRFSADVSASLTRDALIIESLIGAGTYAAESFAYDIATQTAFFYVDKALPAGDYRAVLPGSAVQDPLGNHPVDATVQFWHLPGDANRDRTINFDDLVVVAQNYESGPGKTWALGDFNGDGLVNFDDLVVVAQNYETSLPALADLPPAAGSSPASASPMAPRIATPPTVAAQVSAPAESAEIAKRNSTTSVAATAIAPPVPGEKSSRPKRVRSEAALPSLFSTPRISVSRPMKPARRHVPAQADAPSPRPAAMSNDATASSVAARSMIAPFGSTRVRNEVLD